MGCDSSHWVCGLCNWIRTKLLTRSRRPASVLLSVQIQRNWRDFPNKWTGMFGKSRDGSASVATKTSPVCRRSSVKACRCRLNRRFVCGLSLTFLGLCKREFFCFTLRWRFTFYLGIFIYAIHHLWAVSQTKCCTPFGSCVIDTLVSSISRSRPGRGILESAGTTTRFR